MLNCESCQLLIADALYSALDANQQQAMRTHTDSCESCRRLLADMQRATQSLQHMGMHSDRYDDIPERAALDGLWEKLQPELNAIDAERYRQLTRRNPRTLAAGFIALAASLALIITFLPIAPDTQETLPPQTATNIISPELMEYLARAEVMLLLVANAETQSVSAVPIRQTFARDMAQEANVLNSSMQNQINSGQSRLLKDIEFLLMQIANLDDSNMEQGVQLLQAYLEDNSVLFKIRLLEMRSQDTFI